ncbi:MAG: PIN domain-containing protein [Ignavibacteria bacterium]
MVNHLTQDDRSLNSDLELLMKNGTCFTTVLNASEIIFSTADREEKEEALKLLSALKVLGLNSRYSLNVDEFSENTGNVRDALFCIVAKINKLKIITTIRGKYKDSGLEVIYPEDLWSEN